MNIEQIKKRVQKAIDTLPATINLKRLETLDDGFGGVIEDIEVDVASFNAFIDFASNKPYLSISVGDTGTVTYTRNIKLLAVYSDAFTIKKGDYFTYKGQKYSIRFAVNNFDIYWECELEVVS